MAEHAGNHWYKCDLHLHTMTSRCYLNKENTAKEWVARAVSQGLNAVAVTDHNDYRGISEVMEEGKEQGLAVFPGVEITCDTSKIHMLILFDTGKKPENVRDFLIRCDIDSDQFGDPEGTSLGVFEVCEIAKKRGAMVIAAHIDEFNAVNSMNTANLEKLFSGGYIDAVQVSNVPVWRKLRADKDVEAMQNTLREKYGADATPQEVDRWRKCFNLAERMNLPMLAFSDNPASPTESKHGLDGIGSVYTWIQMDDVVNLESIRQSLLTADSRIRMCFDSPEEPKTEPDLWIRSIEVRQTTLNPHAPIRFDFHPQLNCIIGGKGSGKSAVIQVMSGVGRHLQETLLMGTLAKQKQFYVRGTDDTPGIFREESEIEIHYSLFGMEYKMLLRDIKSLDDQKASLFRVNPETGEELMPDTEQILRTGFAREQVYLQRQINEMISTPGALLDLVDASINGMYMEKARRDYYLEELVNLSASLQAAGLYLLGEERVQKELEWYRQAEQSEILPVPLKESLRESMEDRKKTIQQLQATHQEALSLLKLWETLQERYEDCLAEIRRMRTDYIESVLAEDGNYKMELVPNADRESFRLMRKELIQGDEELMAEDIRKLEEALFAKNGGTEEYKKLLLGARVESLVSRETIDRMLSEERPEGRIQKKAKQNAPEQYLNVFSAYFSRLIGKMSGNTFERLLLFQPEDELRMYYHPNGVKKFYPMTTASAGEKATALFTFILSGSTAPLMIDQPEDDMDNRAIYEEIIPKLKKAKQKRQLIIVTHNANIAMNADPEMIIAMDSKSKFIHVKKKGSVDNDEIRAEICDIMEGTKEGFTRRARKYHMD